MLKYLTAVADGRIDRLMILMPPGHAKSSYASVLFPPWFFAQARRLDVLGVSHASTLAETFSRRVQQEIKDHEAILGYGLENESVEEWRTTNGGTYRAAGVGGSITGRRADLAIIDDPVKDAVEAESLTTREANWEWYISVLYTRLKPNGRIIVIQTRWHPDDLSGRLLAAQENGGDRWTVLKMPAICDSLDDPLGRPIGAALWPELQDEKTLARIRTTVGPHVWGSLFQQDPRPRGSSFFTIDDLLVDGAPVPVPDRCESVFGVIDTAIKAGQKHNSTAVTFFSYDSLVQPTSTLILDWDIVQIEGADQADWLPSVFARLEELAKQTGARKGSIGVWIEDKATGTVLLQQSANLRKQGAHSPAYPIPSNLTAMGKEERAIAASPYLVAQGIKVTEPAWTKTKVHKGRSANHLITQVSDFRLASKETDGLDLLDTFCYGILITHGASSGDRKGI